MNENLKEVSIHMKKFGLSLLGQAVYNVVVNGRGSPPFGEAMAVVQITHAGEILIKAAIAEQHPLLIFSSLPKLKGAGEERLSFKDLVEEGKSAQYFELPDRLWAATGYPLSNLKLYQDLGKLRNTIQHFAVPTANFRALVFNYACEVLDPLIRNFWKKDVFYAMQDLWDEQDDYLFESGVISDALRSCNIQYNGWLP
ncbi:hypothetical protein KKF34_08975 [Myxococcota bacterium]|nr:hypothetical protein [Myxococcota bacterium]MBU1379826.1 hypothetical protein [Myxococcota bacterium]MBU1496994.1 hypothetical protein [Myxococcota bacterium]